LSGILNGCFVPSQLLVTGFDALDQGSLDDDDEEEGLILVVGSTPAEHRAPAQSYAQYRAQGLRSGAI